MRARRSTALLLSCVLGLFLFTAPHAGATPQHGVHRAAMVVPIGFENALASRTTHDDALTLHAHRVVEAVRTASDQAHVPTLTSAISPSPQVRGPPGAAHD